MIDIIHRDGCACGKVRYEVKGNPQVSAACHCKYCQQRSESAFGTLVYLSEKNFKIISGKCNTFNFISESGYNWTNHFCKTYAITLISRLEIKLGYVGVAGGTFDPPNFCTI